MLSARDREQPTAPKIRAADLLGEQFCAVQERRQGRWAQTRKTKMVGHSIDVWSTHATVETHPIFRRLPFFFSLFTPLLSSFWTSRGRRCRPFFPPHRFLPSIFIAHRVQQSHCWSSFSSSVANSHALALSSSQFVHKKSSYNHLRRRFYTFLFTRTRKRRKRNESVTRSSNKTTA